jgi:hypothetical protein
MHIFIEQVEQEELVKVVFVLFSTQDNNNHFYNEYKD